MSEVEKKVNQERLKRQENFNEWMKNKVKSIHYASNTKMNLAIASIL